MAMISIPEHDKLNAVVFFYGRSISMWGDFSGTPPIRKGVEYCDQRGFGRSEERQQTKPTAAREVPMQNILDAPDGRHREYLSEMGARTEPVL